jgi:hypothetical protein
MTRTKKYDEGSAMVDAMKIAHVLGEQNVDEPATPTMLKNVRRRARSIVAWASAELKRAALGEVKS